MINTESETQTGSKIEKKDSQQEEVAEMIDGVLGSLKTKFEMLSSQILSRMDQMGERMDSLEQSLTDLLDQNQENDK